ncbi:unnamed protein product [Cochlearia groenlandica]
MLLLFLVISQVWECASEKIKKKKKKKKKRQRIKKTKKETMQQKQEKLEPSRVPSRLHLLCHRSNLCSIL